MRKFLAVISILFVFASCEKTGDCVKSTGKIVAKDFDGLEFNKILINKGVAAVITQGDTYKVEVQAGENLINDIEVKLTGNMLTVSDNTTCNWTREYGATVVYITAPDLTDIYSKTEKSIISNGILTFPNLRLAAMDSFDGYNGVGTGDFIMQVQAAQLTIDCNTVSRYFVNGTADNLNVNFYESGGIFHGENLFGNNVYVYHRGTNDMIVNPQNAIRGDIYNSGNVIAVHHPEVVEVTPHYQGRLIFY